MTHKQQNQKNKLLENFQKTFSGPIPKNSFSGKTEKELMEIAIELVKETHTEKKKNEP